MGHLRTRLLIREAISLMVERVPRAGGNEEDPMVSDKERRTSTADVKAGAISREGPNVKPAAEQPGLTYNTVIPWPKTVAKVPYAKTEGVGPGERRLAKILNGEVMGGSATFDLTTPMGKFEVKEPTGGFHGGVRVESEGIAAIEANLSKIKNAAKKIDAVFGTSAKPEMLAAAKEMYPSETFQMIVDFATKPETKGQTAIQWILRGEIGSKRLKAMGAVLLAINSGLLAESIIRLAKLVEDKYVTLGDTVTNVDVKKDVDMSTYVKVGKALDLSPDEMKVGPGDMLRAALNTSAFTNPDEFVNSILSTPVKASQVFGHTDGLILVQPEGYMIIPKAELDQKMQFLRISKGKPYFKLAGGGKDED